MPRSGSPTETAGKKTGEQEQQGEQHTAAVPRRTLAVDPPQQAKIRFCPQTAGRPQTLTRNTARRHPLANSAKTRRRPQTEAQQRGRFGGVGPAGVSAGPGRLPHRQATAGERLGLALASWRRATEREATAIRGTAQRGRGFMRRRGQSDTTQAVTASGPFRWPPWPGHEEGLQRSRCGTAERERFSAGAGSPARPGKRSAQRAATAAGAQRSPEQPGAA